MTYLVAAGARPYNYGGESPLENPVGRVVFGADTPEEIVAGVVSTWVDAGMPTRLPWGCLRLNYPEIEENRVPLV
ncbi:hypothetical protein EYW49_06715 [Siculibacillus lacustris]|uniref:Uncharacterized protein n=1 Tax=Siculibacillus lacustris TaxID=1549641 RepID=A0A4Q9VWS7_9HYPH|nr:hypothetical protein [Siculibacillus lacustris]TBW39555.1 hypothetical protein EYW49_06715 [Siculibacillus lacustris]